MWMSVTAPGSAAFTASTTRTGTPRRAVDLTLALPAGGRFRLNVYPDDGGLAVAARVLKPAPPARTKLALPADLSWVTQLSHGLVLFCGPTGSGKSKDDGCAGARNPAPSWRGGA